MLLRRWVVLIVSIMVAAALVSPAGAGGGFAKKFDKQVKKKLSKAGTINKKKNPVNWTRLKGVPAGLADGTDDGLTDIDACADGSAIQSIAPNGSVECEVGAVGGGDITAVLAGLGLDGGGTEGEVTIAADTSVLQARINGDCFDVAPHAVMTSVLSDGSVQCTESLIDNVVAGTGLTGGGASGNVTLAADTGVLQARVSQPCFGGAIAQIDADGTVNCTNYVWDGLQIVTKTGTNNSTSIKIETAACPAGKRVIGGGANLILDVAFGLPSAGSPFIMGSYPDTTSSWTATGVERDTYASNWRVDVYAICAVTELPL